MVAIESGVVSNDFIKDVMAKLFTYGGLSHRQYVALIKAYRKDLAERFAPLPELVYDRPPEPCPEGRLIVSGEVLAITEHFNDYDCTLKMTVKDSRGFLVWATILSSVDVQREDVISFTATLTRSDRDPAFGFAKRPTKCTVKALA